MSATLGTWVGGAGFSLRDGFTLGLGWVVIGSGLSTGNTSVGFGTSGVTAWAQPARKQSTRLKRKRTTPFSLMYALHMMVTNQGLEFYTDL
jgi:hypothetical protein